MKQLIKLIACLVLLAGLGHIFLALAYDDPAMQMQVLGGGLVYLLLGVFIWFKSKIAIIVNALMMLVAVISSSSMMTQMGYPLIILGSFLVINVIVVVLPVTYLHKDKHLKRTS